jgi:hypothetical protein
MGKHQESFVSPGLMAASILSFTLAGLFVSWWCFVGMGIWLLSVKMVNDFLRTGRWGW